MIPIYRTADSCQRSFDQGKRLWQELLNGGSTPVVVPANSARIVIDLDDYFCAYPDIQTSGGRGAVLRLSWAETLYDTLPIAEKHEWIGAMPKGIRDQVQSKFFHGVTDEFVPDGGEWRQSSPQSGGKPAVLCNCWFALPMRL